jgi:hypothetical protein
MYSSGLHIYPDPTFGLTVYDQETTRVGAGTVLNVNAGTMTLDVNNGATFDTGTGNFTVQSGAGATLLDLAADGSVTIGTNVTLNAILVVTQQLATSASGLAPGQLWKSDDEVHRLRVVPYFWLHTGNIAVSTGPGGYLVMACTNGLIAGYTGEVYGTNPSTGASQLLQINAGQCTNFTGAVNVSDPSDGSVIKGRIHNNRFKS